MMDKAVWNRIRHFYPAPGTLYYTAGSAQVLESETTAQRSALQCGSFSPNGYVPPTGAEGGEWEMA